MESESTVVRRNGSEPSTVRMSKEAAGSQESRLSKDNPCRKFKSWLEEVAPMWKFSRLGDEPDDDKREFPVWKALVEDDYQKLYLMGLTVQVCLKTFPEKGQSSTLYDGDSKIVVKCVQEKLVAEHEALKYYRLRVKLCEPGQDPKKIVLEAIHWMWSKEKVPDSKSIPWAIRSNAENNKSLFFAETYGTQAWALQLLYLQIFMVEKKKIPVDMDECYRFLLSLRGQEDEKKILMFHLLYVNWVLLHYSRQYMAAPEFDKWFQQYAEIKKEASAKLPGENLTIVTRNLQQFQPSSKN